MFGFGNKTVIELELVEPLIFLRKPPSWSVATDSGQSNSCQLRGVVSIRSRKKFNGEGSSLIVRINLIGKSRIVHWIKGVTQEQELQLHDQSTDLPIPVQEMKSEDEFSYAYSLPFSFAISPDLPPTVDTEFGRTNYSISAVILQDDNKGKKDVIAKTTKSKDIYIVSDPGISETYDAEISAANSYSNDRSRTFEGDWQNRFHWKWTFMASQSTMGGTVPVQFFLAPLSHEDDSRATLRSIRMSLHEHTEVHSSSSSPNIVRRSWNVLVMGGKKDALLPAPADRACHPKLMEAAQVAVKRTVEEEKTSCTNPAAIIQRAEQQLFNPQGPWTFCWDVRLPSCENTRCNSTVVHPRSPVLIKHFIEMKMFFQRKGDEGLFEVKVSMPFILRCIYLTDSFSQLPCYYCSCFLPHPYEAHEERSEGGLLVLINDEPQTMVIKETMEENSTNDWFFSSLLGNTGSTISKASSDAWIQNRQCTANKWVELTSKGLPSPPSYSAQTFS